MSDRFHNKKKKNIKINKHFGANINSHAAKNYFAQISVISVVSAFVAESKVIDKITGDSLGTNRIE